MDDRLRPDCSRCFALCCIAHPLTRSADFAIDKPAGVPCPNLTAQHRCTIHGELAARGFAGCVAYDCLGAGQQVAQVTFGGRPARGMLAAFEVMLRLHQLLWYLDDALARPAARPAHPALAAAREEVDALTRRDAAGLAAIDLAALGARVDRPLSEASALVRGGLGRDHRRADLAGAELRGVDLRAASLRGALLLGADLRGADLRRADLIGADLRGADVRGADLREALYVTPGQLGAAKGDNSTRLSVARPGNW